VVIRWPDRLARRYAFQVPDSAAVKRA